LDISPESSLYQNKQNKQGLGFCRPYNNSHVGGTFTGICIFSETGKKLLSDPGKIFTLTALKNGSFVKSFNNE
jgi:hypothetical protein